MGVQKLLIVSHVIHRASAAGIAAYGPYVREIEMWADLFDTVTIAAPTDSGPPDEEDAVIRRANVRLAPQPDVGKVHGPKRWLAALQATCGLGAEMMRADAIHVRCPGNLELLGAYMAPLFSRRIVAKYAGSWPDYAGEPRTYRAQKRILRSRWWRGPVTVYGTWPKDPEHVRPFFTAALSQDQLEEARRVAASRTHLGPPKVLFVGRLSTAKNIDVLIQAIAELARSGPPLPCTIVGDGPEREALQGLAHSLEVAHLVRFAGAVDVDDMPGIYEQADVLVLVSRSEGWPKAIAEAMAFGLVCIGSNQGLMPQMLDQGRGYVVPAGDQGALIGVLSELARAPRERREVAQVAARWAADYSLERLREGIRDVLEECLNVRLEGDPVP